MVRYSPPDERGTGRVAEGDLAEQVVVMLGLDQPQVIDAVVRGGGGGAACGTWRPMMKGIAWPTGRPSQNTSTRVRSSESKRNSMRRPIKDTSTL